MNWFIANWEMVGLAFVGIACLLGIGLLGVYEGRTTSIAAEHKALLKKLNTKWLSEYDV